MAFEKLGEFELDRSRLIGKGSWGEVYIGRQVSLNRPVAIKLLKPELTQDEDFIKRFKRESECLAKMVDEHIIQVYSAGEYQSSYYFAMELVQGQPLSKIIETKHKFSDKEIGYVGESVAQALKTAWESPARIVHRDIKPSNIMVAMPSSVKSGASQMSVPDINLMESRIKVMDFGLAKIMEGDHEATMAGAVIGTPKYLSPEQGMGKAVDIRSDIYSLGIVMYEMATDRIPFEAGTAVSMIRHHIYDTAIAPSQYNPDIPLDLEAVIMKCIQKDPDRRYASPTELLEDLDAFRHRQPVIHARDFRRSAAMDATMRPAGNVNPVQPKSRLALYFGAAGGAIILILLVYIAFFKTAKQPEPVNRFGTVKTTPPRDNTASHKNISNDNYNMWMNNTRSFIELGKWDEAWKTLYNILRQAPDDMAALALKSKIAVGYYNLATDYRAVPDYANALLYYNKAIGLNPEYADAYLDRGVAYYDNGQYDKALADYNKAIELNPQDKLAYFNRGLVYYYQKDYDKALKEFNKTIELDPRYTVAYLNCGIIYFSRNDDDRAIANYSKVINLDPKEIKAYYNRGLSYFNKGDYSGAIEDFHSALKLDLQYLKAYQYLWQAYAASAKYDDAIADYTQFIDDDPSNYLTYNYRGLAYYYKKEFEKAIADYNTSLELKSDAIVYYNRGLAYHYSGEYDKAIADLTKALENNAEDHLSFYYRGMAYAAKGNHDKAIIDYTLAIKIVPGEPYYYYYRGVSYEGKGNINKAKADYKKALELDPKFQQASNKLQGIEQK